jgi:hypothetical protein
MYLTVSKFESYAVLIDSSFDFVSSRCTIRQRQRQKTNARDTRQATRDKRQETRDKRQETKKDIDRRPRHKTKTKDNTKTKIKDQDTRPRPSKT